MKNETPIEYVARLAEIVRKDGHLQAYDGFAPNLICASQAASEARYFSSRAGRFEPEEIDRLASAAAAYARAAVRYIANYAHVPATPAGNHEF